MSLKSLIEKMDSIITEGTKETETGRIHKAEPGGYGRKDDEDDEGKKVEPKVKRGRGRPKKDADSDTGEVKKYDFAKDLQSFMVGNLPGGKAPGKKGQVHKIKDESIEESTSVTDFAPKSKGGTRAELLAKYKKTKNPKDAEAARKAGATQKELQNAVAIKEWGAGLSGNNERMFKQKPNPPHPQIAKTEKMLQTLDPNAYSEISVYFSEDTPSDLIQKYLQPALGNALKINVFNYRDYDPKYVAVTDPQLFEPLLKAYIQYMKESNVHPMSMWNRVEAKPKSVTEATKETPTGKIHKAEPGGYGRKDDEDSEGKKVQPQVKRGRGRPKKDADSDTGEVKKWDTDKLSSWIIGNKPKTLPGKAGVKHKLKDWMEHVEREMIVESITQEGRMGDVDSLMQDLASGEADIYDVMNNPSTPEEQYASKILQNMYDDVVIDSGLHPDDDFEKIIDMMADRLSQEHGRSLDETQIKAPVPVIQGGKAQTATVTSTSNDPAETGVLQAAAEILKKGKGQIQLPNTMQTGTTSSTSSTSTAGMKLPAGVTPMKEDEIMEKAPPGEKYERMVLALKKKFPGQEGRAYAIAWDAYNKAHGKTDESVMESMNPDRLKEILDDHPHEHKLAQEGWGMHESLYQTLCDYYWKKGRIPRDVMYGPSEGLRKHVEECYMEDTQPVMDESLADPMLTAEGDREDAEHAITTPAFMRKARDEAPLSLSKVGTTDRYKVGDKTYSISASPLAHGTAAVTGQEIETLPESELEASLRGSVENMEEDYMNESKVNEKYMGFKKTVAAIKKGGSAENPEAVAAAIGRKKYGKEKFQKAAAAGKKLGEQGVAEGIMKSFFVILDDRLINQISDLDGAIVDPDTGTVETSNENTARQLTAFAKANPSRLQRKQPEQDVDEGMWDKIKDFGQAMGYLGGELKRTLTTPSTSNAGQKFGKGQVTPGGPLGPIARYQNRNKNEDITKTKDMQMESWENQLSTLLNEGMTITTSTGNEGASDSVSISATDADAQTLMKMLQNSGLMRGQSSSMSTEPQGDDHDSVTVEPVSADEVMGTLAPGDDGGEEAMGFLKRMLGARSEHSHCEPSDDAQGDYEEEKVDESHADMYDLGATSTQPRKLTGQEPKSAYADEPSTAFRGPNMPSAQASKEAGDLADYADAIRQPTGAAAASQAAADKKRASGILGQARKGLSGMYEEDEIEEELKGGQKKLDVAEPKGKLTAADFKQLRARRDGKVDEDALDQPATMESDDWADAGMQDLAASFAEKANSEEDTETEKAIAMSEGEDTCNECGMYESKCECDHEEKLDEWANSPNDSDEKFLADLTYMTKTISGGLNNMKQDQTVLPSTRVKTEAERHVGDLSMAEMLRKLQNIN